MQTETGVRNNGTRQRGHAARGRPPAETRHAQAPPRTCQARSPPSASLQRDAATRRGGPFPVSPSHPVGTGGEPLSDPARHKCQGAKEMGAGAAELALSIPGVHKRCRGGSRSSTELALGCLPGAGCGDAPPERDVGVPPPADPHQEAPEASPAVAAAGPCCPLVPSAPHGQLRTPLRPNTPPDSPSPFPTRLSPPGAANPLAAAISSGHPLPGSPPPALQHHGGFQHHGGKVKVRGGEEQPLEAKFTTPQDGEQSRCPSEQAPQPSVSSGCRGSPAPC